MSYWLDSLAEAEVESVLINTHWLAPAVSDYLAGRRDPGPDIQLFHEPDLLGSAGTIAACADWAAEADVILSLYGDLFSTQPLRPIIDFHLAHEEPFTLSVAHVAEPSRCGIATVDEAGIVTDFIEKPEFPESDLAGAGIYAMDPGIVSEIRDLSAIVDRPFDLGHHVLPRLAGRMRARFLDGIVHDIGTHAAYAEAQEIARQFWKGEEKSKG